MTIAVQPIRGKVARVLSSREIAINRGRSNGVEVGMYFNILSTKGAEIKDPDTGEDLGSVDLVKTRVRVKTVYERVSVASTYRSERVNVGGTGIDFSDLSRVFEPPKWETRVETLKVDVNNVQGLDEEESLVHLGDPVVQDIEATLTERHGQS